jgi:adenine-specific DNA-methyltransferase
MARAPKSTKTPPAATYRHPEPKGLSRPDVGTQAQFKKRKPPATYRYDSSLSPALDWDGQNPAREQGEVLIKRILDATSLEQAKAAAGGLKALGRPFLDWAGKAERGSFEVPTLPLFVHERLSTKAILETLKGHARDKQLELDLFGDPGRSIKDQVLRAYEYQDDWVNRIILGDSLIVMSSLLHYEGMKEQVQMIYMDPPYGVSFGSNFQPFVRKRDVKHNDDDDLTREPEMVQAYRDTWELGLHSYLTYLRDRMRLCWELLHPTGSMFVQISDDNVHHVREVMDEIFRPENLAGQVVVQKTGGLGTSGLKSVSDYLLWYAKDIERLKYRQLFRRKVVGVGEGSGGRYDQIESPDGKVRRALGAQEKESPSLVPAGWRPYQLTSLTSGAFREKTTVSFTFEGETFHPGANACWKTTVEGLQRLVKLRRIQKAGRTIRYVRYLDDFPAYEVTNVWDDVAGAPDKLYVVQTSPTVLQRCVLMTTDPGDLVFDPTCGSGTTAYVAEQWGRRWITTDVSRVPLALARQRLLTATYDWHELQDEKRGPAGGFVYKRRQNQRGEEVGGIIPHTTLGSLANDEPPKLEVLVDRPEEVPGIVRVTGPFAFEATIPTPARWDEETGDESPQETGPFTDRLIEVLRKSPTLRLPGGKSVTFRNVRPPAKTLVLSAEAVVANGEDRPVAFVFGPESGAVSERLVFDAAREAFQKRYAHLYVIGFAVEPQARDLVEHCDQVAGVPATYVQATPDILMGDLLKNTRSSQIFSVCGLPDVEVKRLASDKKGGPARLQVSLLGLDLFDPVTMEAEHEQGGNVPAWLLDTDYNGLCFHVDQAFFPRTSAWDSLKRALKAEYEESVWQHLAGTTSAPFEAGEQRRIAVKVIDDRGNELLVVKSLEEAKR